MAGGIGDFLGSLFRGAGAEDGVHMRVLNELRPFTVSLSQSALRAWLPSIASGTLCEIPAPMRRGYGECQRFGVSACVVCMRPCCLEHGMVGGGGEIVCAECVALAREVVPPVRRERARRAEEAPRKRSQKERAEERKQERREQQANDAGARPGAGSEPPPQQKPPPRPEDVKMAREILGVGLHATWDDVKAAHRKLSGQWHPDRFSSKSRREQQNAEKRFKQIQLAKDVLAKVYDQAA